MIYYFYYYKLNANDMLSEPTNLAVDHEEKYHVIISIGTYVRWLLHG